MRRLILMRHAKSDWNHPSLSDHNRPLNKRGERSAAALGDWLRERAYIPDQVLCSSARRTGQTLLGLKLDAGTDVRYARALYHADAQHMRQELQSATGGVVLMVGHNPGICEFAHRILATEPPHDRFADYPTGATLVCDFDVQGWNDIGWHEGQPTDFIIPRELI